MAKEVTKKAAPAPAAAKKKTAAAADSTELLAYNVRTKEKEPMLNAVITKTVRGGYMASGTNAEKHKLTALLSEVNARRFVTEGKAKAKGWK